MISTVLDNNYNLQKISEHIHFDELSPYKGCKFKIHEDVYVSIIATKETSFYTTSATESFKLQEGYSFLKYLPKDTLIEIKSLAINSKCLFIIYSKDFIDRLGTEEHRFFQLIQIYTPHTIQDVAIHSSVVELLQVNGPAYLRNIQQKSKVLEIFFKQLTFISNLQEKDTVNLRLEEIKKVEKAKKLIDENISNTYTIPELSRIIGTNEQYLKQHFKQQYGMTIRSYILKNKMNHAKELLLKGDYKVAVIANKIGYKHATHFTTAFKRYFGFLPNSIRFNWIAYLSPYYLDLELELLCIL